MSRSYSEELVYTTTEDGLLLTGLLIRPAQVATRSACVVWIHGNTGTFCDYPYITLGREVAGHGYAFLSGNTRGHDISATLWRLPEDTPVAGGSAWERLEDAPLDLAAWIEVASSRGGCPVALVGHSLGAAKVVLYQAARRDPRVCGLALASPDLHGHWPLDIVEQAHQLVAAGRGEELVPPLMGAPWYRLSASNVVSRATILPAIYEVEQGSSRLSVIQTPLLAFFGTRDVGGEAELRTIRRAARSARRVETQVIDAADHVYTDREPEIARLLTSWVATLS